MPRPAPGHRERGARIFLDADAAARLDDQVLDAVIDQQNQVEFVLADQQASERFN
jgi:hypothetical protein